MGEVQQLGDAEDMALLTAVFAHLPLPSDIFVLFKADLFLLFELC